MTLDTNHEKNDRSFTQVGQWRFLIVHLEWMSRMADKKVVHLELLTLSQNNLQDTRPSQGMHTGGAASLWSE